MDARFITTASEADVAAALGCWPELARLQLRPVVVTAFGDIFVETREGPMLRVDVLELSVDEIADSRRELEALFADVEWASETMLVDLALLASGRGIARAPDQVFAIAPHPALTGEISVDRLVAMSLPAWHEVCAAIRRGPR